MIKRVFLLIITNLIINISVYSQSEKPKLIVEIVVEQMRYDYLMRYWEQYGEEGFKKLINEGTVCKNAKYDYLITTSSSGYATISTGTSPSNHGIIADNWYHRLKEKEISCVIDEKEKIIGANVVDNTGKSPLNLITSTWSDELQLSNFKQSKVIGISLKDYGAILSAGFLANGAYWYDTEDGKWISSTYYMDSVPQWVKDFNQKGMSDIYIGREWTTLRVMSEYSASLNDGSSFETGFFGNTSFPYNLTLLKSQYSSYEILKYTPFGNTMTKDFALSALVEEELGKDDYTDFLSIGFCATGNISDLFGIRSVEIEDTYLRLDNEIAHLLLSLDELIGIENVLVFLTSDRGSSDGPLFLNNINMQGSYFNSASAVSVLNSYLKPIYGYGEWVQYYHQNQIYLNQVLIEDSKLSLAEVQEKAASFMVQFTGIANAFSTMTLINNEFSDGIFDMAQNSCNQERCGDILINFTPGWIEKNQDDNFSLSAQISPYNHIVHVPLIWYGWKIPAKKIYSNIKIEDIAPTLSFILDIALPNASTGSPITELLEE